MSRVKKMGLENSRDIVIGIFGRQVFFKNRKRGSENEQYKFRTKISW